MLSDIVSMGRGLYRRLGLSPDPEDSGRKDIKEEEEFKKNPAVKREISHLGLKGEAQALQGYVYLVLDCTQGNPEALADFLAGELLDVAEAEDLGATRRQLADGFLETASELIVVEPGHHGIGVRSQVPGKKGIDALAVPVLETAPALAALEYIHAAVVYTGNQPGLDVGALAQSLPFLPQGEEHILDHILRGSDVQEDTGV